MVQHFNIGLALLMGFLGAGVSKDCPNIMHSGVGYTLLGEEDTSSHGCMDNLVYEMDGAPGSKFCFRTNQGNAIRMCAENLKLIQVTGKKLQKVAGSYQSAIWGITTDFSLVCRADPNELESSWKTQLNTLNLVDISVGTSEVWGASKTGVVYKQDLTCGNNDWTIIQGSGSFHGSSDKDDKGFSNVSVYEKNAWVTAVMGHFLWHISKALVLTNTFMVTGDWIKSVSIGKAGVWYLQANDNNNKLKLHYIEGTCGNPNSAGSSSTIIWSPEDIAFIHVPVEIAGKYLEVWGIDMSGRILRSQFPSCLNIKTTISWKVIQSEVKLVQLNVGAGILWGVDKKNDVWQANVTNLI